MQNEVKMKSYFIFFRRVFLCLVCLVFKPVLANISDRQSLAPIEWEKDFVETHALSAGVLGLFSNAEIVDLEGQTVRSAFTVQLVNYLRDRWSGRLGFHLGRSGTTQGQYIWTYFGSDLQHPLLPESISDNFVFRYSKPIGFFGLGAVSRWENMTSKLNPVPALRYNVSEAVFYAGAQILIPLTTEFMLGFEYRVLQSIKVSNSRGGIAGLTVHWGKIDRK